MDRKLGQPDVEFHVLHEDDQDAAPLLALAAAQGGTQEPGAGPAADDCATGEGGLLLVAYVNRRPTGCGGYRPFAADPAGETAEITRMYVVPGSQLAGLGRLILAELEGAAEEDGYRRVAVRIGHGRRAARALFEITGYRPWPVGSDAGAPVYAKNLPPPEETLVTGSP